MTTVGSLCSGIGGLELAVGGTPLWVAENNDAAGAVLAARFPGVPNRGDWTDPDVWPNLDPVDIIVAGLPCQPISAAGNQKGTDDDRWLYDDLHRLLGHMADRGNYPMLFLENVSAIRTVDGGAALRRTIRGLASLGWVGRYGCVRASDVGAPHRRERWFCVARHPSSTRRQGEDALEPLAAKPGSTARHTQGRGRDEFPVPDVGGEPEGETRRSGGAVADAGCVGPERRGEPGVLAGTPRPPRTEAGWCDPCRDAALDRSPAPTNPDGVRLELVWDSERQKQADADGCDRSRFGGYAAAILRWEQILGRPAPDPTAGGRLSPRFVEWMMGYPEGWVTDIEPRRKPSLRMLGNAVVPQQGRAAFDVLT